MSVVKVYSDFTAGATIGIATSGDRKDPSTLPDCLGKSGISITHFTPSQFALLTELYKNALKTSRSYRNGRFGRKRLFVLVTETIHDLYTPAAAALNSRSPSELVIQTCISQIKLSKDDKISSLGGCNHPVADHTILTPKQPLTSRTMGELVVGGRQASAGHFDRPELAALSFVNNPFAFERGRQREWDTILRTDDQGRSRPVGQFQFHGCSARGEQIKPRGFRVDVGEVEKRIYRESQSLQSGLVNVAVVPRYTNGGGGDLQLVAFLVPKGTVNAAEATSWISQVHRKIVPHLNKHMLPNGYQILDRLPLTIGGKVDRKNLLGRAHDLIRPESEHQAASKTRGAVGTSWTVRSDELERSVIALFRITLGDEYSDPNDNLFQQGGHSVLLVRLQSRIRKRFKIAPTLPQLIKEPTAKAVCAFIRRTTGGDAGKNDNPDNAISWNRETKLPTDSRYIPRYAVARLDRDDITKILVAGAEISTALYLIAEILATKRDAVVYALGSLEPIGADQMVSSLEEHGLVGAGPETCLEKNDVLPRVRCIYGCLSKPSFGLSQSDFCELGREVQAIYHLGGHTSLLKTYTSLKAANVNPILDLIQLAGTGEHLSEIHYLSTSSVAHLQSWSRAKRTRESWIAAEDDMSHFQPPTEDDDGYFKSCWVAEALLCSAASRGFPVTITRAPAVISLKHGNSMGTGGDDLTVSMVLAMAESGKIPVLGSPEQPSFVIDIVPMDYLVRGLFALTSEKAALEPHSLSSDKPMIYHFSNPQPLKLSDLADVVAKLREDGQKPELVSFEAWMKIFDRQEKRHDGATEMVRSLVLKKYLAMGHVMFALDTSKTDDMLENLMPGFSEQCPLVNAGMLGQLSERIGLRRAGRV
ncbi:hypothetical protein ACHAQH_001333 [Verticillium albo-atrum]